MKKRDRPRYIWKRLVIMALHMRLVAVEMERWAGPGDKEMVAHAAELRGAADIVEGWAKAVGDTNELLQRQRSEIVRMDTKGDGVSPASGKGPTA